MKNNSPEKYEFSHEQAMNIEWILIRSIETFYETPYPNEIKGNVQDFFVRYCYERDFPLKETMDYANLNFKHGIQIKMEDIVPESKRGQAHLVNISLLRILNDEKIVFDEEKRKEATSKFCELTGVSLDLANPIVDSFVKIKRRHVIEKEIYSFFEIHTSKISDDKKRRLIEEEVITGYAKELKTNSQYIRGVLKNKKKKDAAERKRIEEFRASKKQGLSDGPNDEGR